MTERAVYVMVARLRTADALVEVHVVSFPSPEAFGAYRDDPRRREHAALLDASGGADGGARSARR